MSAPAFSISIFCKGSQVDDDAIGAWRDADPVGAGASREEYAPAVQEAVAGKSREDVRALIGDPYSDFGSEWVYVVGSDVFQKEFRSLILTFGESGTVTGSRVIDDADYEPPASN